MIFTLFDVHPLIRLLSFIIFAAFVSLGESFSTLLGLFLLVAVYICSNQLPKPKAWLMVKRLRIFFISIFFMYLWFTPGKLLIPELEHWSPTVEGLWHGVQRISALIILVLGVECLLRLTDRKALLSGIYFLALPFKWLGIDRERMVVRILLTLEAVEPVSLADKKFEFKLKEFNKYFSNLSIKVADKFSLAANHSESIETMEFNVGPPPQWQQWLIPLSLIALFVSVSGSI